MPRNQEEFVVETKYSADFFRWDYKSNGKIYFST